LKWQWTDGNIPLVRDDNELRRIARKTYVTAVFSAQRSCAYILLCPEPPLRIDDSNLHYMRIDGESNTNDFLSTSGTETSVLGEKDHLRLCLLTITSHVFYMPHSFPFLFVQKYE